MKDKKPKAKKKLKKSNKNLILGTIALIFVIVSIGILFFTLKGKNIDNKKVIKEAQEEVSSEIDKIPDIFPKDFPIYPQAKIINSFTAKGNSVQGVSIIWETADPAGRVADFYRSQLETKGWEITSSFNQENSATFSFEKDNISGFIGIVEEGGEHVKISVTLGIK